MFNGLRVVEYSVYLFVVKTRGSAPKKTENSRSEQRPRKGMKNRRDPEEREAASKRKR